MDGKNKLRAIRIEQSLTVAALSRITGLHPTTLFDLEAGRRHAYPKYRRLLSNALDVPSESLFGRIDSVESASDAARESLTVSDVQGDHDAA